VEEELATEESLSKNEGWRGMKISPDLMEARLSIEFEEEDCCCCEEEEP